MAFGNENDIQIKVTLDTAEATRSVQELKQSIQRTLDLTKSQFLRLAEISKEFNKISIQEIKSRQAVELEAIKAQEAAAQRRHEREMARIALEAAKNKLKFDSIVQAAAIASAQEIKLAQIAANEKKKLAREQASERLKAAEQSIRIAQSDAKKEVELQREKNLKIVQDTAKVYQETARIKKARSGGMAESLGGAESAGKVSAIFDAIGKSAAGIGVQIGNVNVVVGTLIRNLAGISGPVGTTTAALSLLKVAVDKLNATIDETATAAGKLEGLKTGFQTLQRSIGQGPVSSLNKLREATQGLISDTDLYQRANQAVLLGVPTDVFNDAAAAAVKLGRAMGIDASFGLESLSLGLGRQSRLYLDNLGIVVSAEEAYRNFGLTIGKSAADLSDAEKKAAFFAEALKKIKERADELPDPIDSVAVAQQKANIAQQNANQYYLEGFNSSKNLADQYKAQKAITEQNAKSSYIYGAALAELGAISKGVANGFSAAGAIIKTGFANALNFVFNLSPDKQIKVVNERIAETKDRIDELKAKIPATGELGSQARRNKAELDELNKSLETDNKLLNDLKNQLDNLDGKKVLIKLQIEGIKTAQAEIDNVFAEITKQAEQQAGIFRVSGLSDVEAKKVFDSFRAAKQEFDNSVKDTAALDTFKNKLTAIQTEVSGKSLNELGTNVKDLASQLRRGEFTKAKETFTNVVNGIKTIPKAVKSATVSVKDLQEGFKGATAQIKNNATVSKKAAKDVVGAVKQQETAWDSFLTKLNRELGTAIDPEIQIRLAEAFRTSKFGSQELIDKLKELGAEVQKRKGDLDALAKEAGEFAEVAQQGGPILQTGAESKAGLRDLQDAQKELADIQSQSLNIRKLFTSKAGGGGFFGFDIGLGPQNEAALANSVGDAVQLGLNLAFQKFTRDDAPQIAGQVGSIIGSGIGAVIGGPAGAAIGAQIGGPLGTIIGEAITRNTQDLASTKERKKIDAAFAELFDGERLGIVIEGEIFTATQKRRKSRFGAIAVGIGAAILGPSAAVIAGGIGLAIDDALNTVGEQAKKKIPPTFVQISDIVFEGFTRFAGDVRFGSEEASKGFNAFSSYFETLPDNIKASFNGVGLAFAELLGVADEQGRLIGIALANNIGGSLQNLQILVQQTGKSFEELSESVLKGFLDSQLTIEEAYNSLVQLQSIYEVGIPGAIGAWEEAIDNLNNVLQSDRPGRYAIDSLRDIGAEGEEAKRTFESVISSLAGTFEFTAQQQVRLFEALRINGITSLAQLQAASDEQLLAILRNIQLIRENATAPLVTTPQTSLEKPPPSRASTPRGKSPQEIAKELLEKQREEARKLLLDSQQYLEIITKINNKQIGLVAAGSEIVKIEKQLLEIVQQRDKFQKIFDKELSRGRKANKELLADLAAALKEIDERLKKSAETAKGATREYKQLDISGVLPLIKSQNQLGVVATQVGVELQKNIDILVKGFLQGRLSISDVNDEIKKTKELLGPGIPNAVGAVKEAFQGLINAGENGGQFSLDAFIDVFAEFREKFNKEGSALRKQQGDQLRANLDAARAAYNAAIGPDALEAAKKSLDFADKALKDFYANIPAPDLSDLRAQLESTFNPDQIAIFFQALGESGLSSFDQFEKAGSQTIIEILGRLKELGFQFGTTSQDVQGINKGLQDAEKSANAGLDPLKEAIDLVKQFNSGATALPPVFNATTAAIDNLNGPLTRLSNSFQGLIEKLGKLGGQTYENTVVFNVRTVGEGGAKGLVDLVFGDGSDISGGTGGGGGVGGNAGSTNENATKRAKIRLEMQDLKKKGLGDARRKRRYNQLREQLRNLGG